MRYMVLTLLVVVSLAWGCAPSDQAPPMTEATPTAAGGDEITEIDFESGEVDQPETESEEPAEEPTPGVP